MSPILLVFRQSGDGRWKIDEFFNNPANQVFLSDIN